MANSNWTVEEGGRESSSSPQIIDQVLAWLKKKRPILTLVHRGYQSGGTVLVGYNESQLEIGKPPDWPNSDTSVRVAFRDKGKIWHYFTVEVKMATSELLLTRRPTVIYRLQRRAHFRVETPRGSYANFLHKGIPYAKIAVQDICAGGMQLHSKEMLPLPSQDIITNISISLAGASQLLQLEEGQSFIIKVRQGRIVRASKDEALFSWGIVFRYSQNEEELLLKYVRQRELEIMRKGLMQKV